MQYKKIVLKHDNPKLSCKLKVAGGKAETATHPKVSIGNILYSFRNLLLFSFYGNIL